MSTIVIRGRTYTVEAKPASDNVLGPRYELRGPRGAHYATIRNVNTPHLMFLVSARKFGGNIVTDGVWLSDEGGTLKVVHS